MSIYRILLTTFATVTLSGAAFADNAQPIANPASTNPAEQTAPANPNANVISKININSANAKELMKVKGINAARARAIVAYRKKNGDFKSVEDLANVRGFKKMKPARLQEIESQIAIN